MLLSIATFKITGIRVWWSGDAGGVADNVLLAELNNYCLGGVYISLVI